MTLRRQTLETIGGFSALVGHLADDAVLGMLVRARGLRIALAESVPATTVAEATLPALFRHELRWARTMRSLAPVGYALSVLQYPLFWAALAVLPSGFAWWSLGLFAAAWVVRGGIARGIDRTLGLATKAPVWLLPLRDLMSVVVVLASFAGNRVEWGGQMLRVDRPGDRARSRPGSATSRADQERGDIAPP
jgi:ceramide glucosyltransferase